MGNRLFLHAAGVGNRTSIEEKNRKSPGGVPCGGGGGGVNSKN